VLLLPLLISTRLWPINTSAVNVYHRRLEIAIPLLALEWLDTQGAMATRRTNDRSITSGVMVDE